MTALSFKLNWTGNNIRIKLKISTNINWNTSVRHRVEFVRLKRFHLLNEPCGI